MDFISILKSIGVVMFCILICGAIIGLIAFLIWAIYSSIGEIVAFCSKLHLFKNSNIDSLYVFPLTDANQKSENVSKTDLPKITEEFQLEPKTQSMSASLVEKQTV